MMVLVINPGSTSTKVGVFTGKKAVFVKNIQHQQAELAAFHSINTQKEFRKNIIMSILNENKIMLADIAGVITIGGLVRPGDAGVYAVNQDMLDDLIEAKYGEHAANLGALIGMEIADSLSIGAYIADPITVDEMQDVARISGMPEVPRTGRSHTLNQKYIAAMAAENIGKSYIEANLIVAHLGGGISVTAHCGGRMIDTNNARGEGPFSIDRTGGLNSFELAKLCYSGKYSKDAMLKKINGNGGIVAYLGTRDFRDVIARCKQGDQTANEVFAALVYQVAKEIAAMSIPLDGRPDAIVLTGGMAHSQELTNEITKKTAFLGPVLIYPGEQELEALAAYLDGVLSGKYAVQIYKK